MQVVDASVWLAAFDSLNRDHDAARAFIARPTAQLVSLDLTFYEVAHASSRWPDELGLAVLESVRAGSSHIVRVDSAFAQRARELASASALTAYDAAYVIVARDLECALVSLDRKDLVRPGHAILPGAAAIP